MSLPIIHFSFDFSPPFFIMLLIQFLHHSKVPAPLGKHEEEKEKPCIENSNEASILGTLWTITVLSNSCILNVLNLILKTNEDHWKNSRPNPHRTAAAQPQFYRDWFPNFSSVFLQLSVPLLYSFYVCIIFLLLRMRKTCFIDIILNPRILIFLIIQLQTN